MLKNFSAKNEDFGPNRGKLKKKRKTHRLVRDKNPEKKVHDDIIQLMIYVHSRVDKKKETSDSKEISKEERVYRKEGDLDKKKERNP